MFSLTQKRYRQRLGLALISLIPGLAMAQLPAVDIDAQAQVPHISGGVGDESRAEIEALSRQYRLRVISALPDGTFAAGVQVRLKDEDGKVVLDTTSDGPILLANPPPGPYSLVAGFEGQTQTHSVTLPAGGQEIVNLSWDAPPEKPKTPVEGNMTTTITIP